MIPDLTPFLHLRRYITIVHHVPGRIRLKLSLSAIAQLPKVDPTPFVDLVSRVKGVKETRVNKPALSVVVEYDSSSIPPSIWERLLTAEPGEVHALLSEHVA